MDDLTIHNWDKWQSYRKDRDQPPWIKIHRRLMRNPEWVSLSDSERGQLVSMWLLAADHNGVIPASPELIQKLSFMDKPPNLNKFIELGFINDNGCLIDVKPTPKRRQHVTPEENRIEEKRREYITLTSDEDQKLKTKYPEDQLEWMLDKLDFWADKKKKVINGYRYFKKGSWLLEEMEKHFNQGKGYAQAPEPDKEGQEYRDKVLKEFTPEQLAANREKIANLSKGTFKKI